MHELNAASRAELESPYEVPARLVQDFQDNGYAVAPRVFSAGLLDRIGDRIRRIVGDYQEEQPELEKRDTYGKAFLQLGGLWLRDPQIKALCLAPRIGSIAAALLKVRGVRLYHDQALFKEPGGGFTPWHADQHYWPLSNDNSITAWIPLQDTPLEMGPLEFCRGSQRIQQHRDLSISDESERRIGRSLKDYPVDVFPFSLGDVSFHRGWTFHRAGPNRTREMRAVMTVIMMEDGMRVARPQRAAQQNDWDAFIPGVPVGGLAATHLNPVIYSADA